MDKLYQQQPISTTIQWGWRDIAAVLFLSAGGFFVMMMLVRVAVKFGVDVGSGLTSPVLYLGSAGLYGLLLSGVYWFAARRSGWKALGIRSAPIWTILITPVLLVIELAGMFSINQAIAQFQGEQFVNPQVDALSGGKAFDIPHVLLLLLLIAVMAPIAEELFFRGMIYPLIRNSWGRVAAIILSALIFSFFHFIPILIPALFFIGLILALLREWSNSIIPCIILHMMQNGVVVLGITLLMAQGGAV